MSRLAKDSLAYTLVFAIGYLVACSTAGTTGGTIRGTIGIPSAVASRMLSSTVRHTAIFPMNTGNQPVIASTFGFGWPVHQDATITNPSNLGQSFQVICAAWGNASGIHAGFGHSGLVPMLPPQSNAGTVVYNDCTPPIASVGADENGNASGFPIILSGTINNLVAYGSLVSGNQFRCLDTSDTSALQDNTFVRPYYDLANDTVILGSGTTQLALTCSISIPPGDDVAAIQVLWVKS